MNFKYPFFKCFLALGSAVLALSVPLVFAENDLASSLIKHVGKRYMLTVLLLFLYFFSKALKQLDKKAVKESMGFHFSAITVIVLSTLYLHLHFDQGFKILFDEHILSSTAMSIHYDQTVYAQSAFVLDENETLRRFGFVDKRPIFFPFLISLVHSILGFHPENVFLLNSFLTFLLLCLLYSAVYQICGKRSGIFAVLLLTTLPLLAQNTTGGGFEILNLCLIAMLLLSGFGYMKQLGSSGLNLLIIVSVLLANCRYESILYVMVPAGLFILKGIKEKAFKLTWFATFSPLLLISPLLSYSIFQADDQFKQTNGNAMLSFTHVPDNFAAAFAYLFDWGQKYSNSILLSILGCAAFVFLTVELVRWFKGRYSKDIYLLAFSIVGFVVISNVILALNYFWGEWTDPRVARFSLPLQFLFAATVPLSIRYCFKLKKIPTWVLLGVVVFTVCNTSSKSRYINENDGLLLAPACEWSIKWVNEKTKNANSFIISDACIGFILHGYAALSIDSANSIIEYVQSVHESDLYDDILFVEGFWYDENLKRLSVPGFTKRAIYFITEPLDQYKVNDSISFQISRLIRIEEPKKVSHEEMPGFRRD